MRNLKAVEAPTMYGDMMRYVAAQQADGEVDRHEFEPDSTANGWPVTADSDVRKRVEKFVARHIPENHKFVDSKGFEKVVYLDERGRSASCSLNDVPDGELKRMAERYGMRFNGDNGRPGSNDPKPGTYPQTSAKNHGYSKPRTEDVDRLFEGTLVEGRFSIHKPAEADDKLGGAYRDVLALKGDMDAMEEIPADLRPLYKQVNKAMDAISKARQETTQLRGMARKLPR